LNYFPTVVVDFHLSLTYHKPSKKLVAFALELWQHCKLCIAFSIFSSNSQFPTFSQSMPVVLCGKSRSSYCYKSYTISILSPLTCPLTFEQPFLQLFINLNFVGAQFFS